MMLANIFGGLVASVWAVVLWVGVSGLTAISRSGIQGAPNAGQMDWYFWRPVEMLTTLALTATIANWLRFPAALFAVTAAATAFLFYQILGFSGGI